MSTNTIPAIFQGLDLFGAPGSFTNQSLSNAYGALPSHVDEFLGLTPGTTKYGADPAPGAGLWGITGAFTSTVSSAAATAQQNGAPGLGRHQRCVRFSDGAAVAGELRAAAQLLLRRRGIRAGGRRTGREQRRSLDAHL